MRRQSGDSWRRYCFVALIVGSSVGVFGLTTAGATSTPSYYLSLGDSLAEGFQPGYPSGSETLDGYANRLVGDLSPEHQLILENLGCGGATSTSILSSIGCPAANLANDGYDYPDETQAAAAVGFIDAHQGEIGLITIAIGGNDLGYVPLTTMEGNIETLVSELRASAGPTVPIIGVGYPDPTLQSWFNGAKGRKLAQESVAQIRSSINPAFIKAYSRFKVPFVNTAAAFGTFQPFTKLVDYMGKGKVPLAVARICELSWMCGTTPDEHPTGDGYSVIAAMIAKEYLKLVG